MTGKRGRPTEYDPERHPFLAMCLAREGLTEREMAQKLGIGQTTLTRWKSEHSEFRASLKGGKDEADFRVADSLYRRAIGYDYEETEMVVTSKDGETKPARVRKVKKHVAPDVTACIFWLKNRQPEKWRDKVQQELSGPNGGPIEWVDLVKVAQSDGTGDAEADS